jgi:Ca2+-dependent lipid-binding protein
VAPLPGNDDPDAANFKPLNMVTMYISCRNLINLDMTSLTDPLVKVFVREDKNKQWAILGQTEVQQNTLNPNFTKSICVNYFFEKQQIVKFEVRDDDSGDGEQLVGLCEVPLG